MSDLVFDQLITTVIAAAAGALGWFVTQFFGRQLARFYEIRSETAETLYFTENVGVITLQANAEKFHSSSDQIRRCAAKFDALAHDLTSLSRYYLTLRSYNLDQTIKGLTGLANSLGTEGYARVFARHRIEKGLKFHITHTTEEIEEMRKLQLERR